MPGTEPVVAICDELAALFREAGESGNAFERVDELVAACERAAREVAEIAGLLAG